MVHAYELNTIMKLVLLALLILPSLSFQSYCAYQCKKPTLTTLVGYDGSSSRRNCGSVTYLKSSSRSSTEPVMPVSAIASTIKIDSTMKDSKPNMNKRDAIMHQQQSSSTSKSKWGSQPPDVSTLITLGSNQQYHEFTKTLKNVASKDALPEIDKIADIIQPYMGQMIPLLPASAISDWLWSLGRVGFTLTKKSHRDVVLSLVQRLCELPSKDLTPRLVTTSMGGLARLRMKWHHLSVATRGDILQAVGAVAVHLNDREVSNILHSLCKILVPWSAFPQSTQVGLLESFIRVSKDLVSLQGSMAIYSLGLMGVDISNVSPAVRDNIYSVSLAVLKDATPDAERNVIQQNSNVIYGLAKLKANYDELPNSIVDGIDNSISILMDNMNAQETANTIYSLGVLGYQLDYFKPSTWKVMERNINIQLKHMIMQGVSNVVYGMALMKSNFPTMEANYVNSVYDSITRIYTESDSMSYRDVGDGQAIANIVYSLGLSNAVYDDFPANLKKALHVGILEYGSVLSSQEISNLCYGLGLMRANFNLLPKEVSNYLVINFERVCCDMNEQEVCSSMHGFAKMQATWDTMPKLLQRAFMVSITQLDRLDTLCLACTIYSLGLLKAKWIELPLKLRSILMRATLKIPLVDQTISNVIYGLALLDVSWLDIEEVYRVNLLANLASPKVLTENKSQHVANTFLGLAKMGLTWSMLPMVNLDNAFNRIRKFQPQEVSSSLFAIASMETSWKSLSKAMIKTIHSNVNELHHLFDNVEIANSMYALAILTYDCHIALDQLVASSGVKSKEYIDLYNELSMDTLWSIHSDLIDAWNRIEKCIGSYNEIGLEHYDQFGVYFEMMRQIPQCNEFLVSKLGYIPHCTGPHADIPSYTHGQTIRMMKKCLSQDFDILNEFSGFQGVFPIDCAVYYKDKLIAFIEIDGEFHYNQVTQELRRKDRLKEALYGYAYPKIPLFRIKNEQLDVLGFDKAGLVLASWIKPLGKI